MKTAMNIMLLNSLITPFLTLFSQVLLFPETVTDIGIYCFYYSKATEISLPSSLQSLGTSAFEITNVIRLDLSHLTLKTIGDQCFWNSSLTSIVLPETLEILPQHSFRHCVQLHDVVLPINLKKVCQYAFIFTPIVRLDFSKNKNLIFEESSLTGMSQLQYLYLPYCTQSIGFTKIINATTPTIYFRNRIIPFTNNVSQNYCIFVATCKEIRFLPKFLFSNILLNI